MRPSYIPKAKKAKTPKHEAPEMGLSGSGCPLGTVPILRNKVTQLRRTKSFPRAGSRATAEDDEQGYHVDPQGFGDHLARLFIFWTTLIGDSVCFRVQRDGYNRTGCWNLECPGFVQVNRKIPIGIAIQSTAIYGGQQHDILLVYKDPEGGDWCLAMGDDGSKNNGVTTGQSPSSAVLRSSFGEERFLRRKTPPTLRWAAAISRRLREGLLHEADGGGGEEDSPGRCSLEYRAHWVNPSWSRSHGSGRLGVSLLNSYTGRHYDCPAKAIDGDINVKRVGVAEEQKLRKIVLFPAREATGEGKDS
ncbi:hypothetical protein H6P81_020992 [Aristolochia fimbriata]|uniref:Neprosin PEP catalytic domain-containing protein n=1 Tax=Aristolochia fimbriata TaxID=158543 RepID=A0AAV7DW33_ARIFI|nr:hypothetical protein H6P81_020992 [Aristolochia fimbriata]